MQKENRIRKRERERERERERDTSVVLFRFLEIRLLSRVLFNFCNMIHYHRNIQTLASI